jgi:starch-binding outer membrane protein, SusD/RagB family
MFSRNARPPCWRRGPRALVAGVALAGVALSGCDNLLDVNLPGETEAEALDNPQFASLLVLSAQGDFECALSNYVFNAGHLVGELVGGNGALLAIPIMTRNVQSHHQAYGETNCNDELGLYSPLSAARFMADDAYQKISGWTDAQVANRQQLLGRAALWAGYSYILFGEAFCEAAFDNGPALSPSEIFTLARDRFTSAIDHATQAGDNETLNTALVGRARVLLALGEGEAAVADASRVPAGFVRSATRSNAHQRRQNDIFMAINRNRSYSIDPQYWDVRYGGVPDPRVRVTNTNSNAQNGRTPLWTQTKYTSEGSPIRLASYTEAQLIIAEVRGGQTAVDIVNRLHQAHGLPAFQSTDEAAIRAQVIDERRREFFLEGQRLGDLRRVGGFQDWNSAGQINQWTGLQYGGTECFPIPDVERRGNPNIAS